MKQKLLFDQPPDMVLKGGGQSCSRCMSTATTLFVKRAKIGKKGKEILLCDICADASRKTLIGGHGYDWRTISPANADVDLPDTAAQDSASKSNNPAVSG